jgi:cytochrome P450
MVMMQFDPRAPEFRANPYPYYELLQAHAPIFYWDAWGFWFLSRYDDCHALLRDDRLGRDESGGYVPPPQQKPLFEMMSHWMLVMDPPDHTRLRSLVHKAFTPRMVSQLRPSVQQIADDLLDKAQEKGTMEVIGDLAYPLPVTVICVLLGIPPSDHIHFHGWSDAIARSLDLTEETAVYDRAARATVDLTAYLEQLVTERRARPRDDLLSALVSVEEQGEKLTREELFATCALLLIAGHETTVNLIGNGTLALLRHPEQWQRLRENPELVQSAVEELLRYESPVQLTARVAHQDIDYKGHVFRKGQQVSFLLGAANRDASQFPDPARLDIARADNRHLAFGGGIHYCLGAPLARLEGEIAFQSLARRLPNLSLAADTIAYRDNLTLRGLESLPVTF